MTKTVGTVSFQRAGGCCEPVWYFSNDLSLPSRISERIKHISRRIP